MKTIQKPFTPGQGYPPCSVRNCGCSRPVSVGGDAYQAFFHVNPDYAYWYGWAMMVKDLYEIKELARTMKATAKM